MSISNLTHKALLVTMG